ncbi:arylesterase [Pararhizobium haloflavum]|uniref:arylesterase n=1 Tax=Pararhizobium haloflavum TaxID=2037914 RepID=UPI000C19F5AF|nr:arylesterase [Pararhizobium haloflavum]
MPIKPLIAYLLSLCVGLMASVSMAQGEPLQIVGFGDSLMAGYQLPADQAFPVRLEAALRERGHDVEIANAGVSGDTTSAGLSRLDWSVPDGTDGVILELGANDALRGIDPGTTKANLDAMIARLQERGIAVLLAGMVAPPNMGGDYAERFNPLYDQLAEKYDVPVYPFFLEGVAAQARLNLDDGMHPNEEGIAVMVEGFLPIAEEWIATLESGTNG